MRVLFVNSRLSERGGADRWLLGVLSRLRRDVETLLAFGYEDRGLPSSERERVGPCLRLRGLEERGFGRDSGVAVDALRRLIDELEPDVVHANDVTDPALLETIAATGRGVQTVQDHRFFCPGRGKVDAEDRLCHDPMGESCSRCFDDDPHGRAMLDLTRRRLFAVARMKRVTVLSRYMAEELNAAGVARQRIVRIAPFVDGVDCTLPSGAASGEFHLMAGRLAEHKGVRVALAAARQLRGGLPLVVAGDGPLADVVREEARQNGAVRFVGWADRAALGHLLRRPAVCGFRVSGRSRLGSSAWRRLPAAFPSSGASAAGYRTGYATKRMAWRWRSARHARLPRRRIGSRAIPNMRAFWENAAASTWRASSPPSR